MKRLCKKQSEKRFETRRGEGRRLTVFLMIAAMAVTLLWQGGGLNAFAEGSDTWNGFRGNESNMAIVSAETPRTADEAVLKWTQVAASSTTWGPYPTAYMMANGKIVATGGTRICILNAETGEIEREATLAGDRGYAYMPPIYADGMLFVGAGGMVQALDAKTLESRWIYKDAVGGQSLSNLTYSDGYVYTGFWNDSAKAANFVCLKAADEDPSKPDEAKDAKWVYSHVGGFYWSGATVSGDYLVVGGDNGGLLSLNRSTGALADSKTADGHIRCSVAKSDGKMYFTSQGGKLYRTGLSAEGKFEGFAEVADLGGASTSTPLIVNGFAYAGTASKTVAQVNLATGDVKNAAVSAYPQSSMLATTAYGGKTYLYYTCNTNPGSLDVLTVDNATGEMSSAQLYVPEDENKNYCIASAMCDSKGTLYYTNDSGKVFAVGKKADPAPPIQPTQPTQPTQPALPAQGTTEGETAGSNNTSTVSAQSGNLPPKTSAPADAALWAAVSLASMTAAFELRRKIASDARKGKAGCR